MAIINKPMGIRLNKSLYFFKKDNIEINQNKQPI